MEHWARTCVRKSREDLVEMEEMGESEGGKFGHCIVFRVI